MAKYCIHCYTPASDEETVCPSCGMPLNSKALAAKEQEGSSGKKEEKKAKKIRFPKEVRQVLFYNFWSLLFFEFLFYLIGQIVIKNISGWTLNKALLLSGINFVEGTNLLQALTNPLIILEIIFLIALNGFFIGFELFALTLYAHESYHCRKLAPLDLTKTAFKKSFKIFKPKNWLFFPLIIVLMPLLNMASSNYLTTITIPGFIMQFIQASNLLNSLFWLVVTILGLFLIFSCFYLPYFVLTEDSICKSIAKSYRLIKGRVLETCGNTLWASVVMILLVLGVLLLFFFVLAVIVIICSALPALLNESIKNNSTIVLQDVVAFFTGTTKRLLGFSLVATLTSVVLKTIVLMGAPFTVCITAVLFYRYRKEDGCAFADDQLIPATHSDFWSKRRKIILVILLLLGIFAYKFATLYTSNYTSEINAMFTGPKTCAHRGDSVSAPENSKAALLSAIEKGADYVEIDVAQTKDGVLVVSHDNNISRVTGQDINICDATWDEIKDLDTGSWFSPEFSDQRFMTLDEAMDICDGKIKMNIELKPTGKEENFEENCVQVFEEHDFYNKGFFASLNVNTLLKVEELNPRIDTCLNSFVALGALELIPVDIFSVEASFVTKSLVTRVHAANKKIWVWTVNNEDLVDEMIELDVNAIVTDDPVKTKQLTQDYKLTPERIFFKLIVSTFIEL